MKKIPRPDFSQKPFSAEWTDGRFRLEPFDSWFDKYCEPINKALDEAFEVYYSELNENKIDISLNKSGRTRKALLLPTGPIKQAKRCPHCSGELDDCD